MAKKTTRKKSTTKKKTASSRKKSPSRAKKPAPTRKTKKKPTTRKKKAGSKAVSRKKTAAKRSTAKATKPKTSSKKTTKKKVAGSSSKKKTAKTSKKTSKKSSKAKTTRKRTGKKAAEPPKPDKDGYVVINGRRVRMISTKNVTPKKKVAAANTAPAPVPTPPEKPPKTKLKKKDLDHYRDLLLTMRAEQLGDLNAMESEALRSGDVSHTPIHMADVGTDVYDQDFMLGMAESERKLLREIDEALQRIEEKTYGMCLLTSKPIPKARLNAKPWAKYTIEAARMIENGQVV